MSDAIQKISTREIDVKSLSVALNEDKIKKQKQRQKHSHWHWYR